MPQHVNMQIYIIWDAKQKTCEIINSETDENIDNFNKSNLPIVNIGNALYTVAILGVDWNLFGIKYMTDSR